MPKVEVLTSRSLIRKLELRPCRSAGPTAIFGRYEGSRLDAEVHRAGRKGSSEWSK